MGGCPPPPPPTVPLVDALDASSSPDVSTDDGTPFEPEPDPFESLDPSCNVVDPLPTDPITPSHEAALPYNGLHLLKVSRDDALGTVWTVGRGGLISLTTAENTSSVGLKHPGGLSVFEHLALLGGGRVAVSNRGDNTKNDGGFWGIGFINISNPADVFNEQRLEIEDVGAMATHGTLLYAVTYRGTLAVVDTSQPGQAELLREIAVLDTPWGIAVDPGESRAYVADNASGVVVFDISDAANPALGATVPTSASALDLTLDGSYLYVAAGSAGVDVFSVADPDLPVHLTTVDLGAASIAVSANGGALWATTQESVALIDIRNPDAPKLRGLEPTPSFAMDVVNVGTRAWVADWNDVRVYDGDLDAIAPHADSAVETLYFESAGSQTVAIANRGSGELNLAGATADDSRVTVEVDRTSVAAGDSVLLRISVADEELAANPLDTEICLGTNDPNQPLQKIGVQQTSEGSSILIGEPAPDFVLPDLDGKLYTLSDYVGHPVVLVYFATW